jgi:hypothetical protein
LNKDPAAKPALLQYTISPSHGTQSLNWTLKQAKTNPLSQALQAGIRSYLFLFVQRKPAMNALGATKRRNYKPVKYTSATTLRSKAQ